MAHLDLEEQEQLDRLKHFWRQYGNLVTWTLILCLTAYSAWNGWQYWQRRQGAAASGMYAEMQRAAAAGDAERTAKIFADMKDRYPRTTFTEQGGLLAAKAQFEKGKLIDAAESLSWVAEHAGEAEYRAVAKLRLAALLLDQKKAQDAMAQLTGDFPPTFEGLAADRRGDVLQAQGKSAEAVAEYQKAYKAMDATLEYRRLVEAKLVALGAAPEPQAAASGVAP